jgi:hypothetical protein
MYDTVPTVVPVFVTFVWPASLANPKSTIFTTLVGLRESFGDLAHDVDRLIHSQRPPGDLLLQGLPLIAVHADEQLPVLGLVDLVNGANVVVLKGRGGLRLVDEPLLGVVLAGQVRREELEGHVAFELHILGFVDHTHTPTTEFLEDSIMRNGLPDHRVPPPDRRTAWKAQLKMMCSANLHSSSDGVLINHCIERGYRKLSIR